MKETPLLFKQEMVRATLREVDPKDQTRRNIKKLLKFGVVTEFAKSDTPGYDWTFRNKRLLWNDISHEQLLAACPYGQPGDRLWVKETFAHHVQAIGAKRDEDGPFVYAADGDFAKQYRLGDRWKPSIFMPRWASRILLEITNIRVEHLQDINEEDARAEGVEPYGDCYCLPYRRLWESINGVGSWDANPFVWVIQFRRIEQ